MEYTYPLKDKNLVQIWMNLDMKKVVKVSKIWDDFFLNESFT